MLLIEIDELQHMKKIRVRIGLRNIVNEVIKCSNEKE